MTRSMSAASKPLPVLVILKVTVCTGAPGLRTNAFFHTELVPSMVRYGALRWGTF